MKSLQSSLATTLFALSACGGSTMQADTAPTLKNEVYVQQSTSLDERENELHLVVVASGIDDWKLCFHPPRGAFPSERTCLDTESPRAKFRLKDEEVLTDCDLFANVPSEAKEARQLKGVHSLPSDENFYLRREPIQLAISGSVRVFLLDDANKYDVVALRQAATEAIAEANIKGSIDLYLSAADFQPRRQAHFAAMRNIQSDIKFGIESYLVAAELGIEEANKIRTWAQFIARYQGQVLSVEILTDEYRQYLEASKNGQNTFRSGTMLGACLWLAEKGNLDSAVTSEAFPKNEYAETLVHFRGRAELSECLGKAGLQAAAIRTEGEDGEKIITHDIRPIPTED